MPQMVLDFVTKRISITHVHNPGSTTSQGPIFDAQWQQAEFIYLINSSYLELGSWGISTVRTEFLCPKLSKTTIVPKEAEKQGLRVHLALHLTGWDFSIHPVIEKKPYTWSKEGNR